MIPEFLRPSAPTWMTLDKKKAQSPACRVHITVSSPSWGADVPDQASEPTENAVSFGPFRLLPTRQLLLDADGPVHIGSRALGILTCLVEHAGEVVAKDELVARVWPKTFVDDANLRVHVAALRKALGDGEASARYIVTISWLGYSFVAHVERLREEEQDTPAPPDLKAEPDHNLPALLTRMVGRAETVTALVEQLPGRRLVTVLGPGGIGKTTVALAVAHQMAGSNPGRHPVRRPVAPHP